MEIPRFRLYGQDRPDVEQAIQPKLGLREWGGLDDNERQTAFQYMRNNGWLDTHSEEVLKTILYLNHEFLRECPGQALHSIVPVRGYERFSSNEREQMVAALVDFQEIFLHAPDAMVLRMLSKFASCYIDDHSLEVAHATKAEKERKHWVETAFEKFDHMANCLNHIFEQFAVNQVVTRNGFVPRQDDAITAAVYVPTLAVLADPRWRPVSDDLAAAFQDYRDEKFSETITKAHAAVQRFLQILVGEEGKNAKGEVGKLFHQAKGAALIPVNRFTEPLIDVIQSFIVSERATNSTAKPTLKDASPSDAILVLNTVMTFLQFCLHERR